MAESTQNEFEAQLANLRAAVAREKVNVENRFSELRAAINDKKTALLEKLDRVLMESEKQLREVLSDYEKLRASRKVLAESLQAEDTNESLSKCFLRMDSEIAKKRPKWIEPKLSVTWDIQRVFASLENVCTIKTITGVDKSSRQTVSLSDLHDPPSAEETAEASRSVGCSREELIANDAIMIRKRILEVKRPSVLTWQKELPTLERSVVYADNRDGTFRLEWNGESFERANVELSEGEHSGLLLLGDNAPPVEISCFRVTDKTGVQQFSLHILRQEATADSRDEIEASGEALQSVRLVWKKQHPTLSTSIEYLDSQNDRVRLEWTGDSFRSQCVEMRLGEHCGMLSLGDSDALPPVNPFSVRTSTGVQEVLLDTPNK